jgi:hypothetical protein
MKANLILIIFTIIIYSCSKNKNGCIDSNATNYNVKAKIDDGSCIFPEWRNDLIGLYLVVDSSKYYNPNSNTWATNIKIDTVELKKGNYYNEMILVEKGITLVIDMPDSTLSTNTFNSAAKDTYTSSGSFIFPNFYLSIVRKINAGNLNVTYPRWINGEKIL